MKRFLFALLAAASLLPLCACSPELTEQQRLAANAAYVYLSSDLFAGMEADYEKNNGVASREPSVLHAMEYHLDDLDGFPIHAILITLRSDVFCNGQAFDTTYLFIDLPSSTIYDDKALNFDTWRADFSGTCRNGYDALALVLDRYASFVAGSSDSMISDAELRTVFTQEEISGVMYSLEQRAAAAAKAK